MIEGALITGGIMISYWLDLGFSFLDPSSISWRFPIAFQILFALIILATVMFLPESPRWLVLKGKEDEARTVLALLNDLDEDSSFVQDEMTMIKSTVVEMSKGSFKDLFTMTEDRHFHRVVLAYVNQAFQQVSGINLVTYYLGDLRPQTYSDDSNMSHSGYSHLPGRIAALIGENHHRCQWNGIFCCLLDSRIHH